MVREYSIAELANALGGRVQGWTRAMLSDVATLDHAQQTDVAYIDNPYFIKYLLATKAGAVITTQDFVSDCPNACIIVSNPLQAIKSCIKLFKSNTTQQAMIHSSAIVKGQTGERCDIGAYCVVSEGAKLGNGVRLGPNVTIDEGVVIDDDTEIGSNVTISKNCSIGKNVIIGSGSVIGSQPFNPVKEKGRWHDGLDIGIVVIGDGVNIGSNCTVDKGSITATHIEEGVKIDNLVQIGHDTHIGRHSIVVACAAIGAHTNIGQHCVIGGGSAIAGFLSIESNVVITGMTSVTKSITKEGVFTSGTTAIEHRTWRKNAARFKRLDSYIKRLKQLETTFRSDV